MPQVGPEDVLGQLIRVGQVAVMGQRDAVGAVDVERLRLRRTRGARGGVTDVPDAHAPHQTAHVTVAEHIPHHAIVLAQEKPVSVTGDDAGSVLPTVLEHR